ncbi:MAG: PKD domain-containing protein [Flavobacteriales bacterium]|nr:PKD domain-containing protein [Flavobacteriales bacterium]
MKQQKFKFFGYLVIPILLLLGSVDLATAQVCSPDWVPGNECENSAVKFRANSPGRNTYLWKFGDPANSSSTERDPFFTYPKAGTYTVTFSADGPAGPCSKTFNITIRESPIARPFLIKSKQQCFNGNEFCFIDSSTAASGSSIKNIIYLFSDGARYSFVSSIYGDTLCHSIVDKKGGWFNLKVEIEDANGCITEHYVNNAFRVFPHLGVEMSSNSPTKCDSTEATITNKTYANWQDSQDVIGLKDIAKFTYDFGDGTQVVGDSVTNTQWWTGKNDDGILKKWYYKNGTFNAKLTVESRFGCTESFTYKAAATNIYLRPVILADFDSSCTDNPTVNFSLKDGPVAGGKFLWNFGDPPSGPNNFDNKSWTPKHSYGAGPWMISINIVAGPCDIMAFDTITKYGPSSAIGVAFDQILEKEKYQCIIRDSVHFKNHSSWYHDDANYWDEDSTLIFYLQAFSVQKHKVTQIDSIFYYANKVNGTNKDTLKKKYALTDVISLNGYTIYFDATKDSLMIINPSNDTSAFSKTLAGLGAKRRYVFNYKEATRTGNQKAIPDPPNTDYRFKDHVLRLWTLGDNFASQCTTDTKANKNVNLNCNFTRDSLPVHWYTPWDEIYKYQNNGQFYLTPATQTRFSRNSRKCFQVSVYPADTVKFPQTVVLFVPFDSTATFNIPYTDSFGNAKTDVVTIVGGKIYPQDTFRDNYRLKVWRPNSVYKGSVINTVIWEDQNYWIPGGTTIKIKNLKNGNIRTASGPKLEKIKKDEQFEVKTGDSILSRSLMKINAERVVIAAASTILVDTVINGVATTVTRSAIIIDSAYHRDAFFKTNGQCNTVTLWHKDTVHPDRCEHSATDNLALLPPNAKGLKWESGVPCPADGNKLNYYLQFSMDDTKPGCSQQWFEVNYDSLTGPTNWLNYKSGSVLAPPPPGSPIPFVLPYDIIGTWGNKFTKVYTAGEVGSDPSKRPNGSFTIGLVVGNGPPKFNAAGQPIAPECTDTAWYSDMFRYMFMDAAFDILIPQNKPRAICAGETAYFRLVNPIQDSIALLRWNWGYPTRTSGYYEQFVYFAPYKGPQAGRNDANATGWDKSKKWLYNYVVRHDVDELFGDVLIDTIVTRIYRKWDVKVNTYAADKILVDLLKSLNLEIEDVKDDLPYMLGDGTFGCIDTTGLSEYFVFGKIGIAKDVYTDGQYKYHYTDASHTNKEIVEEIFHFRDSSLQGYDTLVAPYDLVGTDTIFKRGSVIPGVYKFKYVHPEVRLNFCDPTKRDTFWVRSNGPMTPNLFLNNNVGCEKSDAKLLNVGYLNQFRLASEAVCAGMEHFLYDSIRYWQYGDDAFPDYYPIDPRKFWDDGIRYSQNKEIKEIDWNYGDSVKEFDRSLKFFHTYDEPGEYLVAIAMKDSIGCKDTAFVTAFVTKVKANFETNQAAGGDPCDGIISFYDSTVVFDPCRGRDTCPNGVYDPCDYVVAWDWNFGDGSKRSVLQNPSHDYTSSGWFTVKLVVHTLLGCSDTVEKQIFIAGPQPRFEFSNPNNPWGEDSIIICKGDRVSLNNISNDPMFDPSWILYWGDGKIGSTNDINNVFSHAYDTVGTFYLSLYMEDKTATSNVKCNRIFPDTSTKDGKIPRKIKVIVQPLSPAVLDISDTIVCIDQLVTFTDKSDSSLYQYRQFSFGDGDTTTVSNPKIDANHAYSAVGTYKVVLIPNYDLPPGDFTPKCIGTDSGFVTVETVKADFDTTRTPDKHGFVFKNTSVNGKTFTWIVEGQNKTIFTVDMNDMSDYEYNWGESLGKFEVCLVAISEIGCPDTTCKIVDNSFIIDLQLYNVFTPSKDGDGDGLNDVFVVDALGWEEFEMSIYNRWGELVYKTADPNIGWDGTVMNKGTKCPAGTYFYVVNYKLENRDENDGGKNRSGTVTLIWEQ